MASPSPKKNLKDRWLQMQQKILPQTEKKIVNNINLNV